MTKQVRQTRHEISLQLACPTHAQHFAHGVPNDTQWLADHWQGTIDVACPLCSAQHRYQVSEAYLRAATAFDQPLDNLMSVDER